MHINVMLNIVCISCAPYALSEIAATSVNPEMNYPLIVSVEVLELPLLLLLLSSLVWLFRLTPVKLCVPVCESLRVEAPLSLVLLCWSVIYKVERVLLYIGLSSIRAKQRRPRLPCY